MSPVHIQPDELKAETARIASGRTIPRQLLATRPEHVVIVLGLIFGLLSLIVTPPMQAPDETEHFYRAYQISEGTLIPTRIQEPTLGRFTGGYLPEALGVVETFNPLRHQPDRKIISPLAMLRTLAMTTIKDDQRRFFPFSNTAAYSPVAYVPQATGILFGRVFTRSPIFLAYFARVANLLAWVLVVGVAVRTTPMLKWSLVAIALTPMSLFVAASASADAVTNACSWWFVAQCLQLLSPDSLLEPWRGKTNLLLLGLVLSLVKIPYQFLALFPVGLMLWGLMNRSQWRLVALLLLVMAVGFFSWMSFVRSTFSPYNPNWNPAAQLEFLVSNPAALCWGTFGYLLPHFLWRTVTQFVGSLGWLDTHFPTPFYVMHLASLLLVAIFDPVSLSVPKRHRLAVVSLGVGLATAWLICFVVLLAGTGVGAYEMFVQGRYFFPIATLLLMGVSCSIPRPGFLLPLQNAAALVWGLYLPGSLALMVFVLRWRYFP